MHNYLCLLLCVLFYFPSSAQTGSWYPLDFTQRDISPSDTTLSPAQLSLAFLNTVKINDSCSGFRVSSEGLILTNKHCIRDFITTSNLPDSGFWASGSNQEIALPRFKVSFQLEQKDISSIVLNGLSPAMSEAVRQQRIENNKLQYLLQYPKTPGLQLDIVSSRENTRFYLHKSLVIRNVNLVGLAGNHQEKEYQYQWPRPSLDFALLRVRPDPEITKTLLSFDPLTLAGQMPKAPTPLFASGFPVFSDFNHSSLSFQVLVLEELEERILIDSLLLQKLQRLGVNLEDFAAIKAGLDHRKSQLKGLLNYDASDLIQEKENKSLLKQENTEQALFLRKKLDQAAQQLRRQSKIRNYAQIPYAELPLMRKVEILSSIIKTQRPNTPIDLEYYQDKLPAALRFMSSIQSSRSLSDEQALFTAASEVFFSQAKADRLPSEIKDLISVFQKDYGALSETIFSESILIDQSRLEGLAEKDLSATLQQIQEDIGFRFFRGILRVNRNQIQLPYRKAETAYKNAKEAYFKALSSTAGEEITIDADGSLRISSGSLLIDQGFTFLPVEAFGKKWSEDLQKMPNTFQNNLHVLTGSSGSPILNSDAQVIGIHLERLETSSASDWVYKADRQRNSAISCVFIQSYLNAFPEGQSLLKEMNKK